MGPYRADSELPLLPEQPQIQRHDLKHSADPQNQRLQLHLDPSQALGLVRNFRVQIVYYKPEVVADNSGRMAWKRYERVFDTRNNDRQITVRKLIAGTYYQFQVAAMNDVGEGPFTDLYPEQPTDIAPNKATVQVLDPKPSTPKPNVVPNWIEP